MAHFIKAGNPMRLVSTARFTVIPIALASAFLAVAFSTGQPHATRIWAGDATLPMARRNRETIEAQLADGGRCELPAGVVAVDAPPTFTSGCELIGHRSGSVLRNMGQGPVIKAMAPGLGYTTTQDITGPVEVGEWMFRYPYGKHEQKPRSVLCRVVQIEPSLQTDPAGESGDSLLRFRRAWPCGTPAEGADKVTLSAPADGIKVGQWMYVTDGPSADAARGEFRRIASIEGMVVRFNEPLRMSYGPAALAWVEPLVGVTLRNVTVEVQPNEHVVPWGCMFKGTVGLRIERCDFGGACDVITSSGAVIEDCRGGPLQLNTTTDSRIERCRQACFYAEEECQDIGLRDCVFGHGRAAIQNCITAYFRCRRLHFRNCRIVGAGSTKWPPPSAFNVHANDSTVVDAEVTGSIGGWSLFGGSGLLIRGFRTDGPLQILKTRDSSVSQIHGPYVELVPGKADDGNRIVDATNVRVGTGWQAFAVSEWKPMVQAAPAAGPPEPHTAKSKGTPVPPKP